jgi:Uma2 family endonuclease
MDRAIEAAIEPLMHSPCLPEIAEALQSRVRQEDVRRQRFYEETSGDQKAEFIDGQVVLHSPARNRHLIARQHLETLLRTYVSVHGLGQVRSEKCLCVFPRNDYEPDVVFFGPKKAAELTADTLKFPIPDFVVEVLSETTESQDRGVKFEDFQAHGVAEYWIVDPDAEFVEQYVRRDDGFQLVLKSGSGEITSSAIAGFSIPIRAIFDPAENLVALRRLLAPENNPR